MTTKRAAPIDLAEMYVLIGGVPVVALGEAGVQIGGEPPNWLLLRRAPSNAVSILRHLDGTTAAGAVLRAHDADPAVWHDLLTGSETHDCWSVPVIGRFRACHRGRFSSPSETAWCTGTASRWRSGSSNHGTTPW